MEATSLLLRPFCMDFAGAGTSSTKACIKYITVRAFLPPKLLPHFLQPQELGQQGYPTRSAVEGEEEPSIKETRFPLVC